MKEEIININYAIHWAKVGVINSLILSNAEIKVAINTIESVNLPFSTPEEALNFADIKIITNKSCLLYIIYIPLTTVEFFQKLLIKPVKNNNKIAEIQYENIIKSHDQIYGITNECKTFNSLSICNRNNIIDISNSSCIPNLLKSRPSKCNQTNNHHIATVNEIAEGLLLLNQFNGDVKIGNETQNLNGTYLIKFCNTTISVNNDIFISRERASIQVLPAILQPTPQEDNFKEVLSLPMMKEIFINNTNYIETLQTEKTIQQLTGWGLIAFILASLVIAIIIRDRKKKEIHITKTTNNVQLEHPEAQSTDETDQQKSVEPPKASVHMRTPDEVSNPRRKFYETPYF